MISSRPSSSSYDPKLSDCSAPSSQPNVGLIATQTVTHHTPPTILDPSAPTIAPQTAQRDLTIDGVLKSTNTPKIQAGSQTENGLE